jgi:hypothetical protein
MMHPYLVANPSNMTEDKRKKDIGKAFSYEPYVPLFFFAIFEPFKDPRADTLAPKLLFIALNFAAMALGVWKVSNTIS